MRKVQPQTTVTASSEAVGAALDALRILTSEPREINLIASPLAAWAEKLRQRPRLLDAVIIGGVIVAAVFLAGIYSVFTRGTYDTDEFVYLLLGSGVAQGSLPYRDFLFFHPPLTVYVMSWLYPLIHNSWQWGRLPSYLLEFGTVVLTYLIARRFCTRPVSVTAALLCASSPIMLTTGTRILPDIYLTFFSALSVYLLLRSRHPVWVGVAGVSFGIAIMFKYPAVLTLPAAVLVIWEGNRPAGRLRDARDFKLYLPFLLRLLLFLVVMTATIALILVPFLGSMGNYWRDTVIFQQDRNPAARGEKFAFIMLYLVLLQPLAAFGLFMTRRWWLIAGYVAGLAYLLTPQVYYHYLAQMIPFASILGAIYLASILKRPATLITSTMVIGTGVALLWGSIVIFSPGQSPVHITSYQISNDLPVAAFVSAHTSVDQRILDDRPELPVLARRKDCQSYFWNDAALLTVPQIQRCIPRISFIVHAFSKSSGFPDGSLSTWTDKWCRTTAGSHQYGAFIYNLHCRAAYVPTFR
jgi:4-amino-4-deoxy-L-arabinose transferase-like glycosyltransferase